MLQKFPLAAVRLLDGPLKDRQSLTGQYLLQLDADRLLHNFRANAGLPSSAQPLGGWESPTCGLRGHFTGHYLSACSQMYAATGDVRFKQRVETLVAAFDECQRALGGKYLSAFPDTQFDTLEREFGGAWAPYYTLHKILAGLLDAHLAAENARALTIASRLGDWVAERMDRVPTANLEPLLHTTELNPLNEYGGIGEAMYRLHQLSGDADHLKTAQMFDRDWFLKPLMEGRDILAGLHANTHIPQALAAARRYEVAGEAEYRRAVEYFWTRTALARSYANGGSSGPRPDRRERSEGGEHWPDAFTMKGTLTPKINESCVANNMLRLTDALFSWSGARCYADFHERAFVNSVLAMQNPAQPGQYIYSHPLAPGSRKVFGNFDNTFWCCYGTTVEAYARLADGSYFNTTDELWVTQFMPSEVSWAEKGVRLTQQTDFPLDRSTRLTIHADNAVTFTLHIRVPAWTTGASWALDGSATDSGPADGPFLSIRREWRNGDHVTLNMPMTLRTESLPGDDHEVAFFHGPTLLAARTPHGLELGIPIKDACSAVQRTDKPSHFTVRLNFGGTVPLVPTNEIVDEAFGVYFKAL